MYTIQTYYLNATRIYVHSLQSEFRSENVKKLKLGSAKLQHLIGSFYIAA